MSSKFHKHLIQVLERNRVGQKNQKKLHNAFEAIKEEVLKEIHKYNPRIYTGGSYKKGVMLSSSYDLDIVVYFPSTITNSPRELQDYARRILERKGYKIKGTYGVALQFAYNSLEIDLVIGKAIDNSFTYANLYNTKDKKNMRTSLQEHHDNIDGVQPMVKLMKAWANKHDLKWHKLAIEIYVAKTLTKHENDYGKAFKTILLNIKSNIESIKFIDPANSNNPIHVLPQHRKEIKEMANLCFKHIGEEDYKKII